MTELNLLDSQTEADLRASVRGFLADRCDSTAVTGMYDGDRSVADVVWRGLRDELGVAAILVPDRLGGAGGTARDAAIIMQELGRSVAPVPFLTSSIMATATLIAGPSSNAAEDLLGDLGNGHTVAALAIPFSAAHAGQITSLSPGDDGALAGRISSVAGALEADVFLVPVAEGGGLAIHRVSAQDVELCAVVSLDMSRQLADLSFQGVASTVVVDAELGEAALDRALVTGSALLAAEQVGLAEWCLDTTVAYLKQRRQFGRLIGSFQVPKHRLTDLYVALETGRSAAAYAAASVAVDDADVPIAAAVAQAWCGDAAVRAAEEAIQLHGGMGMTWEHPAHLYLKRAKANQIALGSPSYHRQRLAHLVDIPGPPI